MRLRGGSHRLLGRARARQGFSSDDHVAIRLPLSVLLLVLVVAASPADVPPSGERPGSAARQGAVNDTALIASLDSLAGEAMGRGRIPGLALALVRDGEVEARTHGVVDPSTGRAVSHDSTRFGLGSMSKLVTAVAALQLRAAGRLDFGEPAARRLPAGALPEGPGGPITLHHLLTHTAGLESASVGVVARSPSGLEGLGAYLTGEGTPRRARPPGELYVYSQHGYGLVGLALEDVSGRSYEEYAAENVFGPLGMTTASFRPEALDHPRTAPGHHHEEGGFRPAPTAYHRIPPAGGLVATPRDVASLMTALLGAGGPDSARVLPPEAAAELFRRQWAPHPDPAVEGTAYGTFEYRSCGVRALTTRGWVGGHSSYLHLVPEHDTGFFVVANASSLQGLQTALRQELHRRLAGGACADSARGGGASRRTPADAQTTAGIAGRYRSLGFASRGIESLGRTFLADEIEVRTTGPDGAEIVRGGSPLDARRVDSLLLSAPWGEGQEELFAFVPGASGDVRYMMWGGSAYERVPPWGRRGAAWGLAAVALAIFLSALAVPAARGLRRLWTAVVPSDAPDREPGAGPGEPPDAAGAGPLDRALRVGAGVLGVLWIVFAAGFVLHLAGTERYAFAFGVPGTARALLWIPPAAAATAGVLVPGLWGVWRRAGGWPTWERLQWSAVVVAGLLAGVWGVAAGLTPW